MKKLLFGSLILTSFQLALASQHELKAARADLASPTVKDIKSQVSFTEIDEGIKVIASVSGLKPGAVHGFHVHEKGECKGPDFKSAGEHFNPTKHSHNSPAALEAHKGDLGNLVANDKGVAKTEVIIKKDKDVNLSSFVGKALILHDGPDDYSSQPSGNSGNRIACGIIKANKS